MHLQGMLMFQLPLYVWVIMRTILFFQNWEICTGLERGFLTLNLERLEVLVGMLGRT